MACCKGCTNRKVGCHATCELYINETKERQELKKKMEMERVRYPTRKYQPYTKDSNLAKFNHLNKRGEPKD